MRNEIESASGLWKGTALMAAALMVIAAALVLVPFGQADAEEQHFDEEVDWYGYHPYMELRGLTQTVYVIWNFGDGSEEVRVDVTDDNPNAGVDHQYPKGVKADYYVTATMHNTYDDGSGEQQGETVKVLLGHVLGYPEITFDTMGGTPETIPMYTGTSSSYVLPEDARPEDPTKTGYTFTGWYTEQTCTAESKVDFTTYAFNKHVTLYAGWDANEYTVTFDLGDVEGTAPEQQKVDFGALIQQPPTPVDPSEDKRTFLGWYYDGKLWDFTTPISGDMTLVAQWSEPGEEYVFITFDGNGGTAGQTSIPSVPGKEITLPDAVRDGFTFDGWFTGDVRVGGAGDKYMVNDTTTLVAHWTEVVVPGEDSDDDGLEGNLYLLIGAIVAGILAIVCLALGPSTGWYSVIGTVVLAIVAVVCGLLYAGVI